MSNLLTACCCGPSGPECPPSSCDLASAYTVGASVAYEYDGYSASNVYQQYDTCFDAGSVSMSVSGLVVQDTESVCDCFGAREPPFTGPNAYNARGWAVTTGASPSITVTTDGSGCTYANCGDYSESNIAGTWSGQQNPGLLLCALILVNEVDENTGLNGWYWSLGLEFTSTATNSCSGNSAFPKWRAILRLTSEIRPTCHEPTGLTWTGQMPQTTPFYPRFKSRATQGLTVIHSDTSGGFSCSCRYPDGGFWTDTGATETTMSVSIA